MKKLSPEEAAKILEDMKVKTEIPKAAVTQWKRNVALDMVIEALKYSEVPNSSDCISRQAAIDEINKYGSIWMEYTEGMTKDKVAEEALKNAKASMKRIIRELPSAQPKKGKWIPYDVPWYKCSVCGAEREHKIFMEYFCPNCGADMRGEEDE